MSTSYPSESILIVDDNTENIALLMRFLEPLQCDISIATGGEQALEILERKLPNLILLDVMMPDMSGFEVCWKIRQNPRSKDVPVVFVTALTDEAHLAEGFDVGGNDYITKPIRRSEVLARVETQLRIHAMLGFQKRLIETLESRIEKTSDGISAMGENISAPLNVIMGFSKIIKEQARSKSMDGIDHSQAVIEAAGKEMNRLMTHLLDMVKTQSGTMVPQPHRFSVRDFLSKIEKGFSSLAGNDCELRIQQPDETLNLDSDAELLGKIFYILLDNADRHMGQGGIEIECEPLDGGVVQFTVSDNGLGFGIEAEGLPLRELLATIASPGLGLRIADQLAQILSVDIRVATGSKGSRFTLRVNPLTASADVDKVKLAVAAAR